MSRDPLLLLEDIEKSCTKVIRFTEGLYKEEVLHDELRADAILLNLHIIGEAVKKLPDDFRDRYSEVAWREIAGLRDIIAHAYFALDFDIIWDAVERDVPALRDAVKKIIQAEQHPEE